MKQSIVIAITCLFAIAATDTHADLTIETVIESKAKGKPLNVPFGAAFDGKGQLYLQEFDGHRTWKRALDGKWSVIAGTGEKGNAGDGGPATKALFNGPHNLTVTPAGDIYIADTWNCTIRKIDAKTGIISTIAGTGEKGFSGDGGPAIKAKFNGVFCITLNHTHDKIHIADLGNKRIRMVDLRTGVVSTVAGNGKRGVPKDGSVATKSPLADPRAVASDSKGNIYILERGGHALRVVTPDGKIKTVAGGKGKKGKADGGVATSTLNGPKHLCVDDKDNVYIADAENSITRKFDPKTGLLTTLPIPGTKRAHGVVYREGWLYVVDSYHHRVIRAKVD